MNTSIRMSTAAPVREFGPASPPSAGPRSSLARWATALEVLVVYSGILLYIWRWQAAHPRVWMALLAVILLSHVAHRDTLRKLGLSLAELRSNAEFVLPIIALVYVPLAILGFARHVLALVAPDTQTILWFAGYGVWAAFQQYLAQSYFHNRLLSVISNRHLSSALVALMFGGAHIPNPVLMVVTTIAEFIFSEAFARHRNIWPLALAHAAGGFLIAAISPASLIHNMRVGPGYYHRHF
jgi:CAAX prenyl protease-like protein